MNMITLLNGREIGCEKNQTILDAVNSEDIYIPFSCEKAKCITCRIKILSGEFEIVEEESVLTEEEREKGYVLACNTIPKSNIRIQVDEKKSVSKSLPEMLLPAKISEIVLVSEEVLKVTLRLPPNANFTFIEGQYINISRNGVSRSYSIANKTKIKNDVLEFFIKKYDNGILSNYWFNLAKVNDLLRINGPKGGFYYRKNDCKNIVFIATGTGIAPIKSIIENLKNEKVLIEQKVIWLFWGGQRKSDFFIDHGFWGENVNFIPVLSQPDRTWDGERGYVQEIVIKRGIDLSDAMVFACGSIRMIKDARRRLLDGGLCDDRFFSDAFIVTK